MMTDLEITKLCAEAMGWHTGGLASKVVAYKVNDCAIIAGNNRGGESVYDPLHDDAQAMALVKMLRLSVEAPMDNRAWCVTSDDGEQSSDGSDLNRAIVECVAKMQKAKDSR